MNALLKILTLMCVVAFIAPTGCIDNVTVDPNSGVATVDFAAQPQDTTTTVKVATVATPEAPVEAVETSCIEEEKSAIEEEKPIIAAEPEPIEVAEPVVEDVLTETEEAVEAEEVVDTEKTVEIPIEVEISNSTEIDETLENIVTDEATEEEVPVEDVKAEETPVEEVIPATEEILTAEETPVEGVITEEAPAEVAEVADEVADTPCGVCANEIDTPLADEDTTGEIVGEVINRCPKCGGTPAVVEPVVEESEVIENIE